MLQNNTWRRINESVRDDSPRNEQDLMQEMQM